MLSALSPYRICLYTVFQHLFLSRNRKELLREHDAVAVPIVLCRVLFIWPSSRLFIGLDGVI